MPKEHDVEQSSPPPQEQEPVEAPEEEASQGRPQPETPVADASGEGEEPIDELEALRQELEETREKEAEYLDGWQRARAELSNARKRFQREQSQAYTNARADLLTRLLPVVDDFARAFDNVPDDIAEQGWLEGIRLIRQKLRSILNQEGVVPIEVQGQEFDPFLHQAVTHEPSDEVPTGHIIDQMQTGYRMGDRVLRPSMVRVSSGPAVEPEPEPEPEAEAEPQAQES
jgi:molecular chaperone GrpE